MGYGEADTRAKLIDPVLYQRGWTEEHIKREETAGAVYIVDGIPRKQAKGRTDYTLRIKIHKDNQPVAVGVIEAKGEDHLPTLGLEQAKGYAKRLNVPFVFCTNGHLYVEYDAFTGKTTQPVSLDLLPSPDELRMRYEKAKGFSLEDPAAKPLITRYARGEATRRYYQDAAIRAVLEKLAHAQTHDKPQRALLSLATGAGKTFIAVNLLKRIADAGQLVRALFVCDRDELRSQAAAAFQNEFGSNAATVSGGNPQKNAKVLIATYQTLDIDRDEADANFLLTHYPENYFSHIVIDECHRSAWGKWSQVLDRNPNAVQIGLTATPRQIVSHTDTKEARDDAKITADNFKHFGEPVYEYEMAQGMEDGYLAACAIVKGRVNLDDTGITIQDLIDRGACDARTGKLLTAAELKALYEKTEYEARVMLPDRVLAMCRDLFHALVESGDYTLPTKETAGPHQKTIIFCASDYHADAVAAEMNNLYADWCAKNGRTPASTYAFKCTASVQGADAIPDFKGASRSHFVATTVDLLSTGVDVPALRNVVFFRYLKSPITFYQMVGRGTRLDPTPPGKLMFHLYDYTGVSQLFGLPFTTEPPKPKPAGPKPPGPSGPPPQIIVVHGFDVSVTPAGRSILANVNGRAMPITVEEYKERIAAKLVSQVPTLDAFRAVWIEPPNRRDLLAMLPESGRSAVLLRSLEEMDACDLYDVLGDLAYGLSPHTRTERAGAFLYKQAGWLQALPETAAETVKAIASQFAKAGTEGLENPQIFRTPEVAGAGGIAALRAVGDPATVLRDTKERMFAA